MGLSEIVEGSFESEDNKKWVIAGIALKAPLKPIYTIPSKKKEQEQEVEADECSSTTPTSVESKIPTMLTCPPAPMKRKPSSKCNYCSIVKELFTATTHDLETVFMRQVEKTN
ncbi:hypothetical protein TanjilG_13860 [Lupinus angustifolius]|uniref:Uncharacterized protein n=1 Tax=Lupinus angustifolius TaxID=3871 RepID=A0A1J7G0B1_LUPAN|nr:PREDICTED: uncharacterized protein LOC109330956 [Lupinus angustifolius]OIV93845.1 hypothetical protein TanjilG_13860 [Lupinus angustifolius]